MGFALVWIDIAKQDHVGQNGTNYDWMLLIEIVIWKLNTSFALMAVWLFALCGHLLVLYHKQMAEELKGLANSNRIRNRERVDNDELWSFLSHFESLCEAKRQLFKDFRSMLIMNCCLSATNILACSYFSINLILSSTAYLMVTWDISDILEFTFRLWLICHTADIIRSSVSVLLYIPCSNFCHFGSIIYLRRQNASLFCASCANKWHQHRIGEKYCSNLNTIFNAFSSIILYQAL